jgi:hypothetical protein
MQRAPLFAREIIAFIVGDKLHNGAIRQRGRHVKNETPFHNPRS